MERRHPFLHLTLAEIREMVGTGWAGRVRAAEPVRGGRTNTLYHLRLEDGGSALWKLYVRGGTACALETDLLRHVAGRVPVAAVLERNVDTVPAHALLGWVEGANLEDLLPSAPPAAQADLGRAVGETLAAIHTFRLDRPGMLRPGLQVSTWTEGNPFTTFVDQALDGRAGVRLGDATARRLRAFATREAERAREEAFRCHLVHGDFNPSNLLVDRSGGAWRVAAVVDWEWSVSSSPLMDLGNVLRDRGWSVAPFRDALLAAYREHAGPLPEDWEIRSDLIELTSALEFLGQPEDRPTIQDGAAARVRACLDRWA